MDQPYRARDTQIVPNDQISTWRIASWALSPPSLGLSNCEISQAEIARTLPRDRSTICRELRRNFKDDLKVPIAEGQADDALDQEFDMLLEPVARSARTLGANAQIC